MADGHTRVWPASLPLPPPPPPPSSSHGQRSLGRRSPSVAAVCIKTPLDPPCPPPHHTSNKDTSHSSRLMLAMNQGAGPGKPRRQILRQGRGRLLWSGLPLPGCCRPSDMSSLNSAIACLPDWIHLVGAPMSGDVSSSPRRLSTWSNLFLLSDCHRVWDRK